MKRIGRFRLAHAAMLLGIVLPAVACSPEDGPEEGAPSSARNILLITMDTTRREGLSCYGNPFGTTPCIDRLAAQGILFERAVAPTPLTLPSHATILTGLDPYEHGVRNNESFVLDAAFESIAEALKARGFATGATLGAFPVEARFGLSQGFDHYDDDFLYGGGRSLFLSTQRRGDEVTARAIEWLEARDRESPFFQWVHYFDPHVPYDPPAPYRERFSHPYDGEVAYMDAQIEKLVEALRGLDLAPSTWLLLVGDHGEALGEHGEMTHGMLIYGATQYVPCILVPPEGFRSLPEPAMRGRRVREVVRLKDLAPTLLDAAGVAGALPTARGQSLLPLLRGDWKGPVAAYSESLFCALEFGWSDLRGVRTAEWSYVRAPQPELYALESDPFEKHNIIDAHPDVARRLAQLCDDMLRGEAAAAPRRADRETIEKLKGLGYAAGSAGSVSPAAHKNPNRLVHIGERITQGMAAMAAFDYAAARDIFDGALKEDPGNPFAARHLGSCLLLLGEFEKAAAVYDAHLKSSPEDMAALVDAAKARLGLGDRAGAMAALEKALAVDLLDADAGEIYVGLLSEAGEFEKARAFLEEGLAAEADSATPYARYSLFELARQNVSRALELGEQAVALDAESAGAQYALGEALVARARLELESGNEEAHRRLLDRARAGFAKALELDPLHSQAAFRMGRLLLAEGRLDEAAKTLESALLKKPRWPEVHASLGDVYWRMKDAHRALGEYRVAESLGLTEPGFLLNYGVLLAAAGQTDQARAVWERALALDPAPPLAARLRERLDVLGR